MKKVEPLLDLTDFLFEACADITHHSAICEVLLLMESTLSSILSLFLSAYEKLDMYSLRKKSIDLNEKS